MKIVNRLPLSKLAKGLIATYIRIYCSGSAFGLRSCLYRLPSCLNTLQWHMLFGG